MENEDPKSMAFEETKSNMLDAFFRIHDFLVAHAFMPIRRQLMDEIDWNDRLIAIKGGRGVGKTDFLLTRAKEVEDAWKKASEDETMMAAGEPDKVELGNNGKYTWIYQRSNNKLLYVDFDGSGVVTKTYTRDGGKKGAGSASGRRRAAQTNSSKMSVARGTPLE